MASGVMRYEAEEYEAGYRDDKTCHGNPSGSVLVGDSARERRRKARDHDGQEDEASPDRGPVECVCHE